MAGPGTLGGLGVRAAGLALTGLGGPQQPQPFTYPVMPAQALPYVAHLYTNTWTFKRTLGDAVSVGGTAGAAMITKPGLKMTLNGGYHPVTLELAGTQTSENLVTDPGFEASDTLADVQVNWILNTPSIWTLLSTATDMRSGRRGLKATRTTLGPNTWDVGTGNTFKVVPKQTYTISIWMKQNAGGVSSSAKLNYYDSTGAFVDSLFLPSYNGLLPWTYSTVTGVAPANAVTASFQLIAGWWDGVTGTNMQVWFDDARVVLGTSSADPIALGDLIQLTEQGDNSGAILYTGIVEEIPDEVAAGAAGTKHQVTLTPLVAELGDTPFNKQYTVLTDVAQMIRDAVALTPHLRVSPTSVGDTGVLGIYPFNNTNALEVLNVAKRIAGVNFWWFVDASGLVWFQAASTANPARLTLKRGSDYVRARKTPSIVGLKNLILALGGYMTGAANPITSTYSNAASQKKYGKRALDPPYIYPTVSDQATLDKIVATAGAAFDRVHNSVEVNLPAINKRLTLATPGGFTARLQEAALEPIPQSAALATGGYLGPYIAQDIEVNGIEQKVLFSDVPVAGMRDLQYELDRIVQRAGLAGLTQPPFIGAP